MRLHPRVKHGLVMPLIWVSWAGVAAGQNASAPLSPRLVARFEECPIILQLDSGPLMGIYQRTAPEGQQVMARTSSDGGSSWSEPQLLFPLPKETGGWGGLIALVDRDASVHVFLLNDAHTGVIYTGEDQRVKVGAMGDRRLDVWHTKSSDEGQNWTPLQQIWQGYTGALNSVVQLRGGRILLPFSYLTKRTWSSRGEGLDAFTFTGQYDCTLVYSDDGGEHWVQSPAQLRVVAPDIVSAYGAVEPVVVELKDGRVWMLLRTQQGRFYESFSQDGVAWSRPRPTAITSSDSPAGLLRIRDGRLMLFWNQCMRFPYAYGGRHVLHAAVSADEGRTWQGCREVARDPHRDQPPPSSGDHGPSYPYPAMSRDGSVFFTTGVATGSGRSVVRFDPRWLDETSQAMDFAAGLEDLSTFGTRGVELVPDPTNPEARVLAIRKASPDWPAAVVWNFPRGGRGTLQLAIQVGSGFAGARVALTDHFSVPFDEEDGFNNVFSLPIGADGKLGRVKLESGRWNDVVLEWDCGSRDCRVMLNGSLAVNLVPQRDTEGLNYLRLKSTAESADLAGLLVRNVNVRVHP